MRRKPVRAAAMRPPTRRRPRTQTTPITAPAAEPTAVAEERTPQGPSEPPPASESRVKFMYPRLHTFDIIVGDKTYIVTATRQALERKLKQLREDNQITEAEELDVLRQVADSQIGFRDEEVIGLEMCLCQRHGWVTLNDNQRLGVQSKKQANDVITTMQSGVLRYLRIDSEPAARDAIAKSALPDLTEDEERAAAPASFDMDKDGGPVRSGSVYAAGRVFLGVAHSKVRAHQLLCDAVTDKKIEAADRQRIEAQIEASCLDRELTQIDLLVMHAQVGCDEPLSVFLCLAPSELERMVELERFAKQIGM